MKIKITAKKSFMYEVHKKMCLSEDVIVHT